MARSDSDEEDTFVSIGTPLRTYDEDEPLKKPFALQDQKVKDSKGRQRFHGAFTGGFSAGYFNTVGTKEGWTPSTFVSSRQKRADQSGQRPEDFMDSEDLGEYGIAPRTVQATGDFTSAQKKSTKRPLVNDGIIPGETPLTDLVLPARLPVGVRLLRKLGWKDGQGIGPRKQRKAKKNIDSKKVYGCSLPTAGVDSSEDEDVLDDLCPENITFAPKDVNQIRFVPKDNLHGLGYSGITERGNHGRQQILDDIDSRGRHKRKGITGQAFGVGALEDDDGDIYATTRMSEYDTVLQDDTDNNTHGWTAPKHRDGAAPSHYTDAILEGFKLLSTQLKPRKVFSPPHIPRDFRPFHKFTAEEEKSSKEAASIPQRFSMSWKSMDASTRREALGETPEIKSVFDLVNDKDKRHMDSLKPSPVMVPQSQAQPLRKSGFDQKDNSARSTGTALTQIAVEPFTSGSTPQVSGQASSSPAPLFKGSVSFKPFAKDPAKQDRYEKYLSATKQGNNYIPEDTGGLTEWERSHEREAFARAAQLYRPMSSMMASRFTQAQYEDDDKVDAPKEQQGATDDQSKAAEMKMYGKLTRDTFKWYPDGVLCKRFNVPNPYPDSQFVGLPKVKRDKFSVFNFLSYPRGSGEEPKQREEPNEEHEKPKQTGPQRKSHGPMSKPLAILASIDLSRPLPRSSESKSDTKSDDAKKEPSDTNEEKVEKEQENERPPFDLFKAIFEDSDEDVASETEEMDEQEPASGIAAPATPPTPPDPEVLLSKDNMFHHIFDAAPTTINNSSKQHSDSSSSHSQASSKAVEGNMFHVDKIKTDQEIENVKSQPMAGEYYGPALPPGGPVVLQDTGQVKAGKAATSRKRKKKSLKAKDKHKNKKKKSKHKKHKDKHKKKKKGKVISITISSASDTDSSSNSSGSNIDEALMHKMKSYSQRPSAADFM